MRLPSGSAPRVTATNTGANADKAAVNGDSAIITSSALTTAAAASYTLTLDSAEIDPKGDGSSIVLASVKNGTNSALGAVVSTIGTQMGRATIVVQNAGAGALNGTLVVSVVVLN